MNTGSFQIDGKKPGAISIARTAPVKFAGPSYPPLQPTQAMLRTKGDFWELYRSEILDRLNPRTVFDELGPGAILLCWEPFNMACHRRLVAQWFEDALGVVVAEYGHDRSASLPWREMPEKPRALWQPRRKAR